jgi:hypothetical protein
MRGWKCTDVVRCWEMLLAVGILLLQSACTPAKTVLPAVSPLASSLTSPLVPPTVARVGEAGAAAVGATTPVTMAVDITLVPQHGVPPSRGDPKLGSSLNQLLEAYRQDGLAEAQAFAGRRGMILEDGRVQVEIVVVGDAVDDVRAAVEALEGEYQGHYGDLLQALVPLDALVSLAQRPDVAIIREPRRAGQ